MGEYGGLSEGIGLYLCFDHAPKSNVAPGRLEVITDTGRRRWFSKDDKAEGDAGPSHGRATGNETAVVTLSHPPIIHKLAQAWQCPKRAGRSAVDLSVGLLFQIRDDRTYGPKVPLH